jgi:hypothetical protein
MNRPADLKSAIVSIMKVAELLNKKSFVWAFFDESCRFGQKPWLFEKLRNDMLFQWDQQFYRPTGFNLNRQYTVGPADIAAAGKATADGLSHWAYKTAEKHNIKILKKEMRLGAVAPGDVTECALRLLSRDVLLDASATNGFEGPSMFYYWNTLHSLRTFFKAKHTLTNTTGCNRFEKAMYNALQNSEYVINGYPHDLLVHDVETLEKRQGKPLTLVICNSYLSTLMVEDGEMDSQRNWERDRPGYTKIAV